MKPREKFETKDLWLASAITLLLNTPPEYKLEGGQTIFVFPKTDAVYKAIGEYNAGVCLPVYTYAQITKRLRSEMLTRKAGIRESRPGNE
jgi:hypothetical protein